MLRFLENVKKKREFRELGDLTIQAEKTLIKIVQAKFFPSENSFRNMNVTTDEEGECRLPNGSLNTITDKIVRTQIRNIDSEEQKGGQGKFDNLSDPNDSSNVLPRVSKSHQSTRETGPFQPGAVFESK
ncbi:hypothetical protein TNCV_4525421 [Trichonephila clavipes]|nr:hypothetical protein TNCV_4525421 [Trichonephila clavipes]